MDWHNVTEYQPTPDQTVTVFTKSGELIENQTWDGERFRPSGLGVKDAVWWLSTELSTREEGNETGKPV